MWEPNVVIVFLPFSHGRFPAWGASVLPTRGAISSLRILMREFVVLLCSSKKNAEEPSLSFFFFLGHFITHALILNFLSSLSLHFLTSLMGCHSHTIKPIRLKDTVQ